ncbi:ROK family transcriptional regulator [Demequina sediminicola]|uniref:ROK family transcriptional regulator n=1 Tax=Demequina sediminicola TaxID=1095026 RepID=UPI00078212DB|nr:ROK family transcriptional regulator [Demequina sediminicola]
MKQGPGDLLHLIRTGEATTRGELQAATGLSRVTVAKRLDALADAGIISEAGTGSATGGRRAGTFSFAPAGIVMVAALDAVGGTTAAVDCHGTVVMRGNINTSVAQGPEATLDAVVEALRALAAEAEFAWTTVVAIAISVPGPTDPTDHRLNDPPIMPGWSGWPIIEYVGETTGVPVYVENDADAMAYGEAFAHGTPPRSLVLVKVSDYIGAGLVLDQRIFRGEDGSAGDIGHIHVGGTRTCRCGRTGCLAAEASGAAIAKEMAESGYAISRPEAIVNLAAEGDTRVTQELRRAGELIGTVVSSMVSMLNPATLVIAGPLASPDLIATIRSTVYAQSLPRATRHLTIRPSELGDDAGVVGLATVAVNDFYSAESVNLRLDTETAPA